MLYGKTWGFFTTVNNKKLEPFKEKLSEQRTGSAVSFPRQAGVKHLISLCSSLFTLLWLGLPPPQRFYPALGNWNRLKCAFSFITGTLSLCCRILLLDLLAKVKLSMWFNRRAIRNKAGMYTALWNHATRSSSVNAFPRAPQRAAGTGKNQDGKLHWLLLGSLQLSGEEVRTPAVSSTSGLSSAASCCLWGPR